MNAETLRTLLLSFLVTIFLVSAFYLRQRKMLFLAYAFWGLFALLLPALGPFFVIAYRPGGSANRKRGKQKLRSKRRRYFQR